MGSGGHFLQIENVHMVMVDAGFPKKLSSVDRNHLIYLGMQHGWVCYYPNPSPTKNQEFDANIHEPKLQSPPDRRLGRLWVNLCTQFFWVWFVFKGIQFRKCI